ESSLLHQTGLDRLPLFRKDHAMRRNPRGERQLLLGAAALVAATFLTPPVHGACCYFSAKDMDILQPSQKVFITFDPMKKVETFTVQPKFEGNALDFGMVIPTPTQPKLHPMPRDFFKHLAVYTIMKKREFAHSKLLPVLYNNFALAAGAKEKSAKSDDKN